MISKFNFVIGIIAVAAGIVAILTYLELFPFRSDGAPPPDLVCVLDIDPTNDEFLLFRIKNEGLVPALSLTIDHFTMRYYKDQKLSESVGALAAGHTAR